MTESSSKPAFGLSKSNTIYFVVFMIVYLAFFVASFEMSERPDKTSYQIGYCVGQLLTSLLLTTFFAWIVWRISGKKHTAASVTFNIVLTLIILGQIGQISKRQREAQSLNELQEQKNTFKQQMASTNDPEAIDAAYDQYSSSLKDSFDKMSDTSTGTDKQFFRIMSEYLGEVQAMVKDWNDAYDVVLSPRILDFSRLNNDDEFNYQKEVLTTYIAKTHTYGKFYHTMVPSLKRRLSVLGKNEKAAAALEGAMEKYASQRPIFEPLMQAHIAYGETMIEVLELLQSHQEEWGFENDELAIYNDDIVDAFNTHIDSLETLETTINTLSSKLIEEL